ncbi:hypothetical protein D3C80_361870 [compost metagenome]
MALRSREEREIVKPADRKRPPNTSLTLQISRSISSDRAIGQCWQEGQRVLEIGIRPVHDECRHMAIWQATIDVVSMVEVPVRPGMPPVPPRGRQDSHPLFLPTDSTGPHSTVRNACHSPWPELTPVKLSSRLPTYASSPYSWRLTIRFLLASGLCRNT